MCVRNSSIGCTLSQHASHHRTMEFTPLRGFLYPFARRGRIQLPICTELALNQCLLAYSASDLNQTKLSMHENYENRSIGLSPIRKVSFRPVHCLEDGQVNSVSIFICPISPFFRKMLLYKAFFLAAALRLERRPPGPSRCAHPYTSSTNFVLTFSPLRAQGKCFAHEEQLFSAFYSLCGFQVFICHQYDKKLLIFFFLLRNVNN